VTLDDLVELLVGGATLTGATLSRPRATGTDEPPRITVQPVTLKRGKRWQVTLGGKPLYTYSGDSAAHQVNGQNIKTFGGTWFSFPVKSGTTQQAPPPAPAPMPPAPYPPYTY